MCHCECNESGLLKSSVQINPLNTITPRIKNEKVGCVKIAGFTAPDVPWDDDDGPPVSRHHDLTQGRTLELDNHLDTIQFLGRLETFIVQL